MASLVLVIYQLLLIISASGSHGNGFSQSKVALSYEDAKQFCTSINMRLANPADVEEILKDQKYKKMYHKQTFWMSIRKREFPHWKFLNGTYYGEEIINKLSRVEHQDCSFINSKDERLLETYCNQTGFHKLDYSCLYKETKQSCPIGPRKGECIKILGRTYVFIHGGGTVYDGFNTCNKLNLQPAVFSKLEEKSILKTVNAKLTRQGYFSTGIVRSGWFQEDSKDMLVWYNWGNHEPNPYVRCAVAVIDPRSVYWKAVSCTEKHHFFCTNGISYKKSQKPCNSSVALSDPLSCKDMSSAHDNKHYNTLISSLGIPLLITNSLTLVVFIICSVCLFLVAWRKGYVRVSKPHKEKPTAANSEREILLNPNKSKSEGDVTESAQADYILEENTAQIGHEEETEDLEGQKNSFSIEKANRYPKIKPSRSLGHTVHGVHVQPNSIMQKKAQKLLKK